jgi:CheY-like chemotaxis protein
MANRERILVVDDEPSIRKYLQTLLEVDGYDVETIGAGGEAIELLKTGQRPDFIILDVLMPELNGLETLKQIMSVALVLQRSWHCRRSDSPGRA